VTTSSSSDHGVTVRYWAGARAATGVPSDMVTGSTVDEVVAAAVALHPALRSVAAVATFLVDGSAAAGNRLVPAGATVEVLPPFAGG
jgi:molybdopterin synthase sulfur carrier subunit